MRAAVHLDEAGSAVADRRQPVVVAERRDLDAAGLQHPQDRLVGARLAALTVDDHRNDDRRCRRHQYLQLVRSAPRGAVLRIRSAIFGMNIW